MKKISRIQKLLFISLLFLTPLFLCLFKSSDKEFEEQLYDWFLEDVSKHPLNLHYTLANPENYGITTTSFQLNASSNTSETYKQRLAYLDSIDSKELSKENQLTKNILCFTYQTELDGEPYYLLNEILSPTLGIQAQLPILLAEYTFRKECDIQNYLRMLTSVCLYFEDILTFEKEKAQYGTFMSDVSVERIIEQCESFICDPENNYLLSIFQDSVENMDELSDAQKNAYISLHNKLIQTQMIPAYQMLIDGLRQLKGSGKNPNGLYYFSDGIAYYEYLLKSNCGLEESVSVIQERLLHQLTIDLQTSEAILTQNPNILNEFTQKEQLDHSPQQILSILQDKIRTDFPLLENVSYEIKYVHQDLEEYLSPAFYLTPPIDTLNPNTIYINSAGRLQGIDLFTTLAHEGFPGHLYQTIYFASTNPLPIRHLLNFGGYIEGWATYVESYAFDYYNNNSSVATLDKINQSINLCLLSLLDIKIHYEGWTLSEVSAYLDSFGITELSIQKEIFQMIVETPSNYVKYYVGSLHFFDLRDTINNSLENEFSLLEFHKKVLEIGPCQFSLLEQEVINHFNKI